MKIKVGVLCDVYVWVILGTDPRLCHLRKFLVSDEAQIII